MSRDFDNLDKTANKAESELMATLARLGGARVGDEDIEFGGRKIRLPESMSVRQAIKFLQRYMEAQEEETAFQRTFRYRPWDGAWALQSALKKNFGTVGIGAATYTFFGKNPPEMLTIDVGPGQQEQVPWGKIEFPILEATLTLSMNEDKEMGYLFHLIVEAPKKYKAHVEGLFKLVEEELRTNSIYKGKAITGAHQPAFIDPYSIDPKQVVYTEHVLRQLSANIWSVLEQTEITRQLGLPLRRTVIFGGPYGTGKTLGAMLTAQKAVENNWTFIQCRVADDLAQVMQTARLYQPAVVFYEDVDVIAQTGDPDKVSKLLDTFDGLGAKASELMVVLTTNHVDKIHKGMMRPGRLDAVINIDALDRESTERLIRALVPETLLDDDLDFNQVYDAMEGFLPAFIKEAVTRAVRYAIDRVGGLPENLTTADLVDSAEGVRVQLNLMHEAEEGERTPTLDQTLRAALDDRLGRHQVNLKEVGMPGAASIILGEGDKDRQAIKGF